MKLLGSCRKSKMEWSRSRVTVASARERNKVWSISRACWEQKWSFCAGNRVNRLISYWHRIEEGFAGRRPLLDAEKTGPDKKTSYH